jgi:hypothetical protein
MDYRAARHRLPRGVVAASEALEHLDARGGRREREQARDLLGRELAQMRPDHRLLFGRGTRANLRPDHGARKRRAVARRGLPMPAPAAGSAHGDALPLDGHAD